MTEISRSDFDDLRTIDRYVEHVSTVPAITGETVQLFVREKVKAGAENALVVLMVHGGYWPGTMAFDFDYKDYSWMSTLARAEFDVFAMDMTGYGFSSRPLMKDPRNLSKSDQATLHDLDAIEELRKVQCPRIIIRDLRSTRYPPGIR
jgi:pimeloyl-ACP methyl ester carboxylesterase